MRVNAVVNKDGTLNTKFPKSLWGKKVTLSVTKEKNLKSDRKKSRSKSNWDEISAVFEKADQLDFPRKTHEQILRGLREFRETEITVPSCRSHCL
ncbi:MAG: hypothetical protein R2941_12575 [Desulfobacterales bacterium]